MSDDSSYAARSDEGGTTLGVMQETQILEPDCDCDEALSAYFCGSIILNEHDSASAMFYLGGHHLCARSSVVWHDGHGFMMRAPRKPKPISLVAAMSAIVCAV